MSNLKRKVILVVTLCVALSIAVVSIIVGGTLAWFSDSDSVKNDFYIADSGDSSDPDSIFSVDVWEYVEGKGTEKQPTGGVYENIAPGVPYTKEPHVVNTGAYDQYIRVTLTISDASAWQTALGNDFATFDIASCFEGFKLDMWESISDVAVDAQADTLTYVLYYDGILAPGTEITLFNKVEIPNFFDQYDFAEFEGDFYIDVFAEAVQADNTGDSATEAFATVGI